MDTTELARVLNAATEHLEPRPGFTAAVVRGGKRRKARNRILITAGAVTVTAVAAAGTYVVVLDDNPGTVQPADPRLSQPTRGDLRGETEFRNAAARAWREGLHRSWNADRGIFDDLRGQPHVYWAGTTPAGPAAVIMQQAYFHPHEDLSPDQFNTTQTLVGLVARDPADGVLRLVYDQYTPSAFPDAGYFQFGPGDRTVLVVERGRPLFYSTAPTMAPDGRITRDWQPLPMSDGVGIAQTPEGGDPSDMRVVARDTRPNPDDKGIEGLLRLEPSTPYLEFAKNGTWPTTRGMAEDRRLKWFDEDARNMQVGRPVDYPVPDDPMSGWVQQVAAAGFTDFGVNSQGWGGWFIRAGLDDGRVAVISELQQDSKPSRIYAVLLRPDGSVDRVIAGEPVDPARTLPVRLRLPDGQGWVVADYGAELKYQTSATGPAQDAGRNAALLPDDAVRVQVTRGGNPTQVDLAR